MSEPSQPAQAGPLLRRALLADYWIFGVTALSAVTLVLFPRLFRGRTEGFLHPHGYCYIWDTALVSSHVVADLLIGVAYVAISAGLAVLVYRVRHLLPFHWMFLAFGLFILTCGATHFMDVWTLWRADFWASAALKIVTAVASVATALALPPLIPQVTQLLHAAAESENRREQLQLARQELNVAEEQNQAKDMFLATLSHELRTPLNAMGGWVHLLQKSVGSDDPQHKPALDAIRRNLKRQERLVEDMLDVSAMLTGRLGLQRGEVDLTKVVRAAIDGVQIAAASPKQITLAAHLPAERVPVTGDEMRLEQVFTNLLSNAVKFSEEGAPVSVRMEREGEHVVVAVEDAGEGIDPAFLPRLFDPFAQADQSATRKTAGLGLGLTIVRYLVDEHGGMVYAESGGPGQGSTFTVRLPVTAAVQSAMGS